MMKRFNLILILSLLLLIRLQAYEIRAMWVLPWSINTPEKLDAMIASALLSQQTDLLLEVRYRTDALYQTNRRPDAYPNPEPRSHVLEIQDFDPLAYALEQGHLNNLRIHAWVVVFNATTLDSAQIAENYIVKNHADWITHDKSGKRMSSTDQYGFYTDPGVTGVREHLLDVFSDLVSGYPELDGLHLDYIRYPNSSLGYHPESVERFKASGLEWNQWRVRQVSSFVSELRQRLKTINPKLILSAAVMPEHATAVKYYAQDWLDWLNKGYVDFVYPMAYNLDTSEFKRQIDTLQRLNLQDRIVVGLRAWNSNGGSMLPQEGLKDYSILDLSERINSVRSHGFAGISLFSYDGLLKDNAISHLCAVGFSEWLIAALGSPLALEDALGRNQAADLSVKPTPTHYILELLIPAEGRWFWEIRADDGTVIYKRSRYYIKGQNEDYWNGYLSDGTRIGKGIHNFCVYREQDDHEYLIPVLIEDLN